MISDERIAELRKYFWDSTDEEEDDIWRFELTEEEQQLVDTWDEEYASALWKLSQKIEERE